jgi:excisionase family DNA binding protein
VTTIFGAEKEITMSTVLLKKSEAALMLRISTRTIDRLRSVGVLRVTKIAGSVRFPLEEIERFIRKNTAKTLKNNTETLIFDDGVN